MLSKEAIIVIIFGTIVVMFVILLLLATCMHSNGFKEIRVLVNQNKDVDPFYLDYCYKKEKPQIEKLFKEHNYKLREKEVVEPRVVHGCGKIEFADGTVQYQIHFSENWFSTIDESTYDSLKNELGNTVNFVHKEKVYSNKED